MTSEEEVTLLSNFLLVTKRFKNENGRRCSLDVMDSRPSGFWMTNGACVSFLTIVPERRSFSLYEISPVFFVLIFLFF